MKYQFPNQEIEAILNDPKNQLREDMSSEAWDQLIERAQAAYFYNPLPIKVRKNVLCKMLSGLSITEQHAFGSAIKQGCDSQLEELNKGEQELYFHIVDWIELLVQEKNVNLTEPEPTNFFSKELCGGCYDLIDFVQYIELWYVRYKIKLDISDLPTVLNAFKPLQKEPAIPQVKDNAKTETIQVVTKNSLIRERKALLDRLVFIGLLDANGDLKELNRYDLSSAQLKVEQVLGLPFHKTFWFNYDDKVMQQVEKHVAVALTDKIVRFEIRVRRTPGSYQTVDLQLMPYYSANGEVVGLIPSGRVLSAESTDRKEVNRSRDMLLALTESLPEPVFAKDIEGNIILANQATIDAIGLSKEQIIGLGEKEFLRKSDQVSHITDHDRIVMETGKSEQYEEVLTDPNGNTRVYWGTKSPLIDENGEVYGLVGNFRDITEAKALEEKKERILKAEQSARKELERISLLRDEFLAMVSHELRTPLTSILGWAEILQMDLSDVEQSKIGLEHIEKEARNQANMIDELLDMGQIIAGKFVLEPDWFTVDFVIKNTLAKFNKAIQEKGLDIRVKYSYNLNEVYGDAHRISQVLSYLIDNAVKYSHKGDKIEVIVDSKETEIVFYIKDKGEGIAPERLENIFDPFLQISNGTTRRVGGLGLGLTLAKRIVDICGGWIKLKSQGIDKGTIASFGVPKGIQKPEEPEEHTFFKPNLDPNRDLIGLLDTSHILWVEDDPGTRVLIETQLKASGGTVTIAENGKQGLEAFKNGSFDLIISDLAMPEVDGFEMIKQIRAIEDNQKRLFRVPAIALSALSQRGDIDQSMEAGYDLHVIKPASYRVLIKAGHRLLQRNKIGFGSSKLSLD